MRIAAVFAFIATTFAPLLTAHGYDSLKRYDLGVMTDLAPFASATTPDGGLWLLAPGGSDAHQLVRLDATGTRSFGLYLPTQVFPANSDRFSIFPLADGGVLELDTHSRSVLERACILRSITRDGALRFERNVYQPFCNLKLSKPGLAPYLLSSIDGAVVLNEDGSVASSFVPGTADTSLIRAEFVNGELLVLRSNESRTGYVLMRANENGTQLWSLPLENVGFNQNVTVRGLSDGRALVLISDVAKLQLRFYSAAGALIETRDIVMPEATPAIFGVWALDGQGNQAISIRFESAGSPNYGAIIFTANGALLKQVRYTFADQCSKDCPLLGLELGFANALTTETGGKLVLVSLLANVANVEVALADAFNPRIAKGANGAIYMSSDRSFRAFNTNGAEITAPSVLGKGVSEEKILAAAVGDDGKRFVLHQRFNNGPFVTRLEGFTAAGTKLWERTIADVGSAELLANGSRVCLNKVNRTTFVNSTLQCFESLNGDELSSFVIPNIEERLLRTRFLVDGRLRVVYAKGANEIKIVDVLNDGVVNQISVFTNKVQSIVDIGANGGVLLTANTAGSSTALELLALRPTGEIAFRRSINVTVFSSAQFAGRILENSEVLISSPTEAAQITSFDAVLLTADGVPRWAVALPRLSEFDYLAKIFSDEKNVYLLRKNGAAPNLRVHALNLTNGASAWTQVLKSAENSTADMYASPNGNEVLVSVSGETGVQLNRLSDSSGAVLEQRLLDCEVASCTLRAAALTSAGDFHAISETQDFGLTAVALGSADVRSIEAEVVTDQTGLSGAWYTPQMSGQGFFVEYFPQSKLLFAPWFTFSVADVSSNGAALNSDSVADLRWYTLSGIVEPGAKVARLEIRRNVAGLFDSAPVTQSTVVGTATLRAQDCNKATLEFEFISSEAGGKQGVLPLDRLTGGSATCQLSNGQTLPGRDVRPAFGGFDGRQSGSWFEPETSGQGLMMTVQPPTSTAPGFFFGGWFTYDAGLANDPTSQHWLTISGEIRPDAQAGVVPVKIYRTLGGQLARAPTQNNTILGSGTVTFSGCESAILRYKFDDALIVGTFRARMGEINLVRSGTCPVQ